MQTDSGLREGPIGLLYPGEMGAAVARLLRGDGFRIVTSLAGRSPATAANCRSAGVEDLGSLGEVVRTASVLLSLVPPTAAPEVATHVREQLPLRRQAGRLVYVDLNSVSPEAVAAMADGFPPGSIDFVDGAILGLAAGLTERGILYLSGPAAARVAGLFEGKLRVQVLGEAPGQASALRMLLSGLTKGVIALFVEMALAGRRAGILDRLVAAYRANYPGVMEVVDRILPTYPRHAARRGQEMVEVERTLSALGLRPTVAAGVRELITEFGKRWPADGGKDDWGVTDVIEELHTRGLLRSHGT
jgi:3-hydroxyisobutyrate dehydrogenase-like beta-hydroxyacid dehydrogenase